MNKNKLILATTVGLSVFVTAFAYNAPVLNLDATQQQYATIAAADQTGLNISGDMTAECWINTKDISLVNPTNLNIMARDEDTNGRSYGFNLVNTAGTYNAAMYNSVDGTNLTATGLIYVPMPNFTPNTWQHVAWVYHASAGSVSAYLNGRFQGTATGLNTTSYAGPVDFSVGKLNVGTVYTFDGQLDQCRMWNKTRTEKEISKNMNKVLSPKTKGLVGQWTFDGNFTDSSKNGNDLTPVNGASIQ